MQKFFIKNLLLQTQRILLWIFHCLQCAGYKYLVRDLCFRLDKLRVTFNKFLDFFRTAIYNCRRLLKIQYVIATYRIRWLNNFYDFRFKWTATAAIGIHPTKACLSQLVNFKNAISTSGHFRRMICNKILF